MTMDLNVPGATLAELARGLRAAHAVLTAAGVTDVQAARALWDLEGWDIAHDFAAKYKPSTATLTSGPAWEDAREAALKACCAGWGLRPQPGEWSLDVEMGR